jgi:hypothetical protein
MSHKDAGAKQTQDYSDHFNHLTHPRCTTGQTMESIMFATILNAIYREFTRTSFRRKDRPGADLAWRLISSCKWRLIRGSLAARGNTPPRRLGLRGKAK